MFVFSSDHQLRPPRKKEQMSKYWRETGRAKLWSFKHRARRGRDDGESESREYHYRRRDMEILATMSFCSG